jgi:hypothetical protein
MLRADRKYLRNGKGFETKEENGLWRFLAPDDSRVLWKAIFIPQGTSRPTLFGEGHTPVAAKKHAGSPLN